MRNRWLLFVVCFTALCLPAMALRKPPAATVAKRPDGGIVKSPAAAGRIADTSVWDADNHAAFLFPVAAERQLLQGQIPLRLDYATFDPVAHGEPFIPATLRAMSSQMGAQGYYIVQFCGPILQEWQEALAATGAQVMRYVPENAYVVRATASEMAAIAKMPPVRWTGQFHPAYKVNTGLQGVKGVFDAVVNLWPGADIEAAKSQLESAGVANVVVDNDGSEPGTFPTLYCSVPSDGLTAVLNVPEVQGVFHEYQNLIRNREAAHNLGVNDVRDINRNTFGVYLNGAGQTYGAIDSGLDNNGDTAAYSNANNPDLYIWASGSAVVKTTKFAAAWSTTCSTDKSSGGKYNDGCGHGTATTGCAVGSGWGWETDEGRATNDHEYYYSEAGMAPEAKVAFLHAGGTTDSSGYCQGLCTGTLSTNWTTLRTNNARVINNSWGSNPSCTVGTTQYDDFTYTSNTYNADAQSCDTFSSGAGSTAGTGTDTLIFFSAGNAGDSDSTYIPCGNRYAYGWGTLGQVAQAKDIVTVGGSENLYPERRTAFDAPLDNAYEQTYWASKGPTADGRSKPDVVAPCTLLHTVRTFATDNASTPGQGGSELLWDNGQDVIQPDNNSNGHREYLFTEGTSFSSPIAAGATLLIRQYFTDVKSITPTAALMKATLIAGAQDMGYGYVAGNGAASYNPSTSGLTYLNNGRNVQGWGLINIRQSLAPKAPYNWTYTDNTTGIATGDSWTTTFTVADNTVPTRVVLVWSDPQGAGGSSKQLVNDLDLTVTGGGHTWHGNDFLTTYASGHYTVMDGSFTDRVNNVEVVNIQPSDLAVGTTYTVTVFGYNVPTTPQRFAVVINGGIGRNRTYQPDLKLTGTVPNMVLTGATATATLHITNWGTNSDTITPSVIEVAGSAVNRTAATKPTVSFSPTSVTLAAGASQDVTVTVTTTSSTTTGQFDIHIKGLSSGASNVSDAVKWTINVMDVAHYYGTKQVTNSTFAQRRASSATDGVSKIFMVYESDQQQIGGADPSTYTGTQTHSDNENANCNGNLQIFFKQSSDKGKTWSAPFLVSAPSADHPNNSPINPAIAYMGGTSPKVCVTWQDDFNYQLFARIYDVNSATWGTQTILKTTTGYNSGNGTDYLYPAGNSVVADPHGNFHVFYLYANKSYGTNGWNNVVCYIRGDGSTWSSEVQLTAQAGYANFTTCVYDTTNDVVWVFMGYDPAASAMVASGAYAQYSTGFATWYGATSGTGTGANFLVPGQNGNSRYAIGAYSRGGKTYMGTYHYYANPSISNDGWYKAYSHVCTALTPGGSTNSTWSAETAPLADKPIWFPYNGDDDLGPQYAWDGTAMYMLVRERRDPISQFQLTVLRSTDDFATTTSFSAGTFPATMSYPQILALGTCLVATYHSSPLVQATPLSPGADIYATALTDCGWASAPTPEHVPYSSTPMKITAASTNNLTWDVTNCSSTNYHVIYGWGSTMGTSPTVVDGVCSLGTTGTATWTPPDPSGDSSKYLWFFVVGDDGSNTEGPWGLTTEGTTASGVCGMTVKNNSGTCSTP